MERKVRRSEALQHQYEFAAKVWKYEGPAGWYFVTLPKVLSKRIRAVHLGSEEGWGRLKAVATVKKSSWKTAIWFDTKKNSYLLPVKVLIRQKEKIKEGARVKILIEISLDPWLL